MIASLPASSTATNAPSTDRQQLEQAAQAFEAIFVRSMIGAMRQASLGHDLMGNKGSDEFRDMMDARMADEMTQTKGLGIADLLIAQWKDKL